MTDNTLTIVGNLTADPELRYTQNGIAVANFTIAATQRKMNRETNTFEDGDTVFMRCSIWRDFAEHAAATLRKGQRVIAEGRLTQRSYETDAGEKRTVVELQLNEVGPSLRYSTGVMSKAGKAREGAPDAPPPGEEWAPASGRRAAEPTTAGAPF